MSTIILFYQNKLKANNKDGYYFEDILKWSDYRLEVEHDFIQWIFPDKSGGVNPNVPKLTDRDIEIFRTDQNIRRNVARITARMLSFYGFIFIKYGVKLVRNLYRKDKNTIVGMYSEHNYKRITRMMVFLNRIGMELASSLIMLAMCYAMHADLVLRAKIKKSGALKHWFDTQKYLVPYADKYSINIMGVDEESGEEESGEEESGDEESGEEESGDEESGEEESGEEESGEEESGEVCKFTGLKYTGNSCYQDSTLLALFAIPNSFITDNILRKELRSISSKSNREIVCGNSLENDYKRRKAIQDELVNITKSMRGEMKGGNRVEYCSNLRGLLRSCPSASRQQFYGTGTQDAGEFLQYIFAIFQVNGVRRIRTTNLTNDLSEIPRKTYTSRQINEEISPVILIPSQTLMQVPKSNINFYMTQMEDSVFDQNNLVLGSNGQRYQRRIEHTVVTEGEYIIFYAQRLLLRGNKVERIYSEIVPAETVKLPSMKKALNLFAVVVHRAFHYTCYIKCDVNNWFYYNDMNKDIIRVGTFEDMIKEKKKPNVKTEGVLYFYKV